MPFMPDFWKRRGKLSEALLPLAFLYGGAVRLRHAWTRPYRAPVPVVCVGNLVVGGAGKTPAALLVARRLMAHGRRPHFLTRGYGGTLRGPVRVDPDRHDADAVGDEALLLAAEAPTWVAANRRKGAKAAADAGAEAIVMDDGFQNPTLHKDLSLLLVDGPFGLGNGRVVPAGPLREPLRAGLARADAAVVVGLPVAGLEARVRPLLGERPMLHGRFHAGAAERELAGERLVAFAGIGRPDKFFGMLANLGARVLHAYPFADHYPYAETDIGPILAEARNLGAVVVTTAKDAVRLPADYQPLVKVVQITLEPDSPGTLDALLDGALSG